jgi:hypothetical protein
MPDSDHGAIEAEDDERSRSRFVRSLLTTASESAPTARVLDLDGAIPRRLVRFWHDAKDVPADVRACMDTWNALEDAGFDVHTFDDATAAAYIAETYGEEECAAFARCAHPAMRCDYLRLCFVLAEGGLYVDADDELLSDALLGLFDDPKLKLQPLGYDVARGCMMTNDEVWDEDLDNDERVYYVNNNPILAPAHHPLLRRALVRSTRRLLSGDRDLEIQATTGPGNITASLVAHARALDLDGRPRDFELLRHWPAISRTRWELGYRNDDRNWRNVYGC